MSILVYIETAEGKIKKNGFEVATYANKLAKQLDTELNAIVLGDVTDPTQLGAFGIKTVYHCADSRLNQVQDRAYTTAINQAAETSGCHTLVMNYTTTGKMVAPRLAVRMNAGMVSGIVDLPAADFSIKKSVFSGKAFAHMQIKTDKKILAIIPNTFAIEKQEGVASIQELTVNFGPKDFELISVSQSKVTGTVPLSEAELVVSGGRGMKGPENWGLIEDLANVLGATMACSRPVADSHWRPHHEHVGQTGGTIRPNLYIAVGISGAIQHLAGVNSSKCIVVINKDPEAPFFAAADYGIVGDAFEVLPKLTQAIKDFKSSQS